jgi:hypothetical protein
MPHLYIPKFKLWHHEQKANQAAAGGSSASKKPMTSQGESASSHQANDAAPCDWQGDRASPELDSIDQECAEAQRTPRPDEACDWRGDVAEPELNDLAHEYIEAHQSSGPNECEWQGDVAEPELDDLGPGHAPKPSSNSKSNESKDFGPPVAVEKPVFQVLLPEPATKPPKKESQNNDSKQEAQPSGKPDRFHLTLVQLTIVTACRDTVRDHRSRSSFKVCKGS